MFVSALGEESIAAILFGLFGLAVVCALGAIAAFTVEMMMAGGDIRAEVAQSRRLAILPSLRHRAKRGSPG